MVQSKLAKIRTFPYRNNTAHPYLLHAMFCCGNCQLACIGRTLAHSPYSYYICSDKFKKATLGSKDCPSRFAPAGLLDDLVWQDLCEALIHPTELTQASARGHGGHWLPQQLQTRYKNLYKGRGSLHQQLDRLTGTYLHDIIPLPEYKRRRRKFEQRDQAIAQQEGQFSAPASRADWPLPASNRSSN